MYLSHAWYNFELPEIPPHLQRPLLLALQFVSRNFFRLSHSMLHLLRAAHKAEVLALALRACLSACGSWFLCKVEMHEEHLLKHHLCLQKFRLRGTTVFHTRRHMCIEAAELCGGAGRRLSQRAALATDRMLPTAAEA